MANILHCPKCNAVLKPKSWYLQCTNQNCSNSKVLSTYAEMVATAHTPDFDCVVRTGITAEELEGDCEVIRDVDQRTNVVIPDKRPHIYFHEGYWRVTKMPKPYHRYQHVWVAAHKYIGELNARINAKHIDPSFLMTRMIKGE